MKKTYMTAKSSQHPFHIKCEVLVFFYLGPYTVTWLEKYF